MSTSLRIVRSFFPEVVSVSNAKKDIFIEVTKRDSDSSQVKKHNACAMAVACKRTLKLNGVIISRKTAYLIKGDHATRYSLPESTSREVVSFDRKGGFAEGIYELHKPCRPLGRGAHGGQRKSKGQKRFRHFTTGVRTVLGEA